MKKITYQSDLNEIGNSLMDCLSQIKKEGETKELKFEMLLKYGRVLFLKNKIEKAYQTFQQGAVYAMENNITEVKEIYFWTARCIEETGDKNIALGNYLMLLENNQYSENDSEFVDAILDRFNFFTDLEDKIRDYKLKRDEALKNPKDLLSKLNKFLKEKKI
ncbi:hypothetical protein [Chryseobacterium sp. MP_3.2]|uniref:hypothetical protein n=1 Tax=Chryseobacterium sp. MP_3.2 TaxID=3071712 RepID=UPI002E11E1D3